MEIPQTIGVTAMPWKVPLKQAALFFDTFVVQELGTLRGLASSTFLAELEWLESREVVVFSDVLAGAAGLRGSSLESAVGEILESGEFANWPPPERSNRMDDHEWERIKAEFVAAAEENFDHIWSILERYYALLLREHGYTRSFPLWRSFGRDPVAATRKELVLSIALRRFPVPGNDTPWQAILDFKQDADAKATLSGLRVWMNRIAAGAGDSADIEDELVYLLARHERHMRRHGLGGSRRQISTILVSAAEVVEDLFGLRWSKSVKSILRLSSRTMMMLEAEATSPGEEVAYIARAESRFA